MVSPRPPWEGTKEVAGKRGTRAIAKSSHLEADRKKTGNGIAF